MNATETLIGKVPPGGSDEDLAAEQKLVGNLLCRPELLDEPEIAALSPSDLYSRKHRLLFKLALKRGPHAKPASSEAASIEECSSWLAKHSPDGGPYTGWVLGVLDLGFGDWRWPAAIVRVNAIRRHVAEQAARLQQVAMDPTCVDPVDMLASMSAHLAGSVGSTTRQDGFSMDDLGMRFIERIERSELEGTEGVATGLPLLDDLLGGGLHPGDVCVIGARPSCGKTSLGRQIARNMAMAGNRCAFFSLEVHPDQFFRDLVTGETRIPAQVFRRGRLSESQQSRAFAAADRLSRLKSNLRVFRGNNLGRIIPTSRSEVRIHGAKTIFVDYLQLVKVSGMQDKRHEVARVSEALKEFALDNDARVIAMAQLNRGADKDAAREPQMADLKESGAIEQDADQILLIHRPGLAAVRAGKLRAEEADMTATTLLGRKNRGGPIGDVHLRFDGQSMTFSSASTEPGPGKPSTDTGRPAWKPKGSRK